MKMMRHPALLSSLILGVTLTGGTMFYAFKYLAGQEEASFAQTRQGVVQHLAHNIEMARNELSGLTASLYAAKSIENDTLHFNTEHIFKRYDFITAALFAPKINQAQLAKFENEQREAGFIDFQVHGLQANNTQLELPARAQYFPVALIEPFDVNHVPLLGLDLMSGQVLSEPLTKAIDRAEDVSVVVGLVDEKHELWLFKPLYSGHSGISDPYFKQNREQMVNAFVGMGLDLKRILLPTALPEDMYVSFSLLEKTKEMVFVVDAGKVNEPAWWKGFMLVAEDTFFVNGHEVYIQSKQAVRWFEMKFLLFFVSGLLGLLLTVMLVFLLRVVVRSEQHKREILDKAFDAVIRINNKGHILDANPAAEKMFLSSKEALLGRGIDTMIALPLWDKNKCASFEAYVKENPSFIQAIQSLRTVDETMYLEVSVSQLDASAMYSEFVLFVRDETERRRSQAQAEHTQRLESLGVLAGGIAHDFNNLLTAIMGHTGLAINKVGEKSPVNNHLQHVLSASESAAMLCKQMLAYSGKGAFVVQQLNLSEVVENISQLLQTSISKSVALNMDLALHLPEIKADEGQMQQIIMNLIINASEAMDEQRGCIDVKTSVSHLTEKEIEGFVEGEATQAGKYVKLTVVDSGCGMDEATMKKMFDPFFTTKFTGRGLGMSALLGIVRGHHAGLRVKSELGEGTVFEIFFPVSQEH